MLLDKGFNLANVDLTTVLLIIWKTSYEFRWNLFPNVRPLSEVELVREFYANLTSYAETEVPEKGIGTWVIFLKFLKHGTWFWYRYQGMSIDTIRKVSIHCIGYRHMLNFIYIFSNIETKNGIDSMVKY